MAELPSPPGKTGGLHPVLARRIAALHAAHPIRVNSGYRSSEDQQLFFDCAQTRTATGVCPPVCERSACASANAPGTSNHEAIPFGAPRSLAADIESQAGDTDGMHTAASAVGLHFPIGKEPWHVQPVEVVAPFFTGNPFPDDDPPPEDLLPDERDAVLFIRAFLQELKDSGWFVGEILSRVQSLERRLSRLP